MCMCSPFADLCSITTLIGIHVQQVNCGRMNSGVCIINKEDDCEHTDHLSNEKSSHSDVPVKDSDCLLLDAMSPSLGCLNGPESGVGRRKRRQTKQHRRHTKWGKYASSDHTSHGITTADTPLLTYSRRKVIEALEPNKERENCVHACSRESTSLKGVEDEMALCKRGQQTLKLIVSLPLPTFEHKTKGESSDQDSCYTDTLKGRRGVQCVGAGEVHSLDQNPLKEEVNVLFRCTILTLIGLFLYHPAPNSIGRLQRGHLEKLVLPRNVF